VRAAEMVRGEPAARNTEHGGGEEGERKLGVHAG